MNQNEMREEIDSNIQAAYDFMDAVVDQATRARHELEHWKTEHGKLSHECARLMLVIARLKEQALAAPERELVRLTEDEIEALRHETFSTSNPFCPCDSKTMRKAANAVMQAMIAKNGGK